MSTAGVKDAGMAPGTNEGGEIGKKELADTFGGLDTWGNPAGAVVKSMTAEELAKRAGYTPRPKP